MAESCVGRLGERGGAGARCCDVAILETGAQPESEVEEEGAERIEIEGFGDAVFGWVGAGLAAEETFVKSEELLWRFRCDGDRE